MADSLPVRHRTQTGNVRPPLFFQPFFHFFALLCVLGEGLSQILSILCIHVPFLLQVVDFLIKITIKITIKIEGQPVLPQP